MATRSKAAAPSVRLRSAWLYLAFIPYLTFVLLAIWPPGGDNGAPNWNAWRWPRVALTLPPELRLVLLVTICGLIAASLRIVLDLFLGPSLKRSVPADQSAKRMLFAAVITPVAWSATRGVLLGSADDVHISVNGAAFVGAAVGYAASDGLKSIQTLLDQIWSRARSSEKPDEAIGQEPLRGAGEANADLLRKRFEREPGNMALARTLVAALRDEGRMDEAAHIFDELIDADPDREESLLDEKAQFYRSVGDESRYFSTRVAADQLREKRLFEANAGRAITVAEVESCGLPFFGNFTWRLQPGVNVLLGRNGYGKSHLLRAIVGTLLNDTAATAQFLPERPGSGATSFLRVDIDNEGTRASAVRTRQIFEKHFGGVPVLAIPDMRYIEKATDTFAPLPTVPDLRRQGAEQFVQEKPFQGVILTFLYELSNSFARSRSLTAPIFRVIQDSVRRLSDDTFAFHSAEELDNAHYRLLVITEGNDSRPLPLQKASQGTLSVISMVGLTYRFLRAVYPSVREDSLREQQAIVVIDEIDAHLHPAWQRQILQLFRVTFPNVQFIVTAHSPLVVGGCLKGEVSVLRKARDGFRVETQPEHFIGATAAELYDRVFGIEDKDLTYLRLNTLQPERKALEDRVSELERHQSLDAAQRNELDKLSDDLFYLNQAEDIRKRRDAMTHLASERDRLEVEISGLKGQISELRARTSSREERH